MMGLRDNEDLVCYLVTKHSWKGKYRRIFSFGTSGITTYNPETLEVTNRWVYSDVSSIKRAPDRNKFSINVKRDKTKKIDTMNFSTEYRAELLTVASRFQHLFMEKVNDIQRYEAHKEHWSRTLLPVLLEVSLTSLNQLDLTTKHILATYAYKDIEAIYNLSDVPDGFIVTMKQFGRMHMFVSPQRDEIKQKLDRNAVNYLGINVKVQNKPVPVNYFHTNRLGSMSDDENTTSLIEFTVNKMDTLRHQDPPQRLLCLTQSCLLERDPESYHIVTIRPLSSIISLVRDLSNPRLFKIEYMDESVRSYCGSNRDSILATILDSVRGVGNKDVHIKMKCTSRGKRLGPYYASLEEEVEAFHLKLLRDAIGKNTMPDMIDRFNCNVPYSGLLHSVTQEGLFKENKEKPITEVLQAISAKCKDTLNVDTMREEVLEALYHAIRRLVASKIGFQAFTSLHGLRECLGLLVVKGLNRNNEAMTHAAVDMICALMHPMHDNYDLKQEQLNKSSLLSNKDFLNNLLDKWSYYVHSGTGALVVSAILDLLTFSLCQPYSETTEGRNFDSLLEMVAKRGRSLFKHFQHPCLTIVKGASLVMRAIVEEAELEVATNMQELALSESALPRHLLISLYTPKTDQARFAQCRISRQLVALWLTNNDNGNSLLHRILPIGLLAFLDSTETAPSAKDELEINVRDNLKLAQDHAHKNQRNAQIVNLERQFKLFEKHVESTFVHWGARIGIEKRRDKIKIAPVVLRKSRQRIKSTKNWTLFYYSFDRDHSQPNLIWNHKTRDELRNALEKEIKAFDANREVSRENVVAWNYSEFEVIYTSLREQLCIDGYYIKILLEKQEAPESLIKISHSFFNNLYHRFLLPTTSEMKNMCLHALAIVYTKYHETIGYFPDTKYIVNMLERATDKVERDRLLIFLHALTLNKENVKDIIVNSQGILILVDLMTLAHLHTSRAVVPTQNNLIEFGVGNDEREQEKEWHFCKTDDDSESGEPVTLKELKTLYANGVINGKTKFWAQGMVNWKLMQNITQLKWSILARGSPLLNESELTIRILNMLLNMVKYYPSRDKEGAVIWPMSRIKRILSSDNCIQHIVQLLLTFDPVIVEKVASLLCCIVEDNVCMPTLYTTGVFYFILMYNGSNVLPIGRFLKLTHTKQAFRCEESYASELMQRSILGQLLPEAMVNYLENYGPEKFAQIFLGEYDTPEAIWNKEMRALLIQKIAAHIADFTPRLWSNNKAQYQYIVIPVIRYPQLANELFCNIFYLRHLCDTTRFPDWPIKDPVAVLRDVLEAWKTEVEKKPPAMSLEEAYSVLGLPNGPKHHHDEPSIRRAYYKLAQKYHPDKNSKGRAEFEAVNKAYEHLCSRSPWMDNGVNTNNVILIIQTQSILLGRYSTELQPYKYAGYKQLVKTIQMEVNDERLFSKQTVLLSSAVELIYHTVKCSALNAEEFNRENGFQIIADAFSRCVSVLSESSKDSDPVPIICTHCVGIFTISAAFEDCRSTFRLLPQIACDLLRIMHFKKLIKLNCCVVVCVSAFADDYHLRMGLLKLGVLWYLIGYLFSYDYTLEECGIETNEDSNQQGAWNRLAKLSIQACAMLARKSDYDPALSQQVESILESLLTPYLASCVVSNDESDQILKTLTSNCENPYLIWDNSTRAELLEYLEQRKASRNDTDFSNVEFSFSSHLSELVIGGIFIRVYNDQPNYEIENPKLFVLNLLTYLKAHLSTVDSDEKIQKNIVMALTSLYSVINNNQRTGIAIQCIGNFKTLFSYLMVSSNEEIRVQMLSVIALLSRNQECVNDIAASGVLVCLLLVLYDLPDHRIITLDCLHALITSSTIVKDLIQKGSLMYLVDIMLNCKSQSVQIKAAEILGRLMEDKVSGPRVRLLLNNLFPAAICDGMHESPQSAIAIIQNDQETPEIIWNEEDRRRLSSALSELCSKQYKHQKANLNHPVEFPDTFNLSARRTNEVVIGGVYLRLYNLNPAFSLRKPLKFLTELFDSFSRLMVKPQDELIEAVGTAIVNVLHHSPGLAHEIPALGHLPTLFSQWNPHCRQRTSYHVFQILNYLFRSEPAVMSIASVDVCKPIQTAMKTNQDLVTVGCDTLCKLYEFKNDQLVRQGVESGLVEFLLDLLGENVGYCQDWARTKALIVKTLKNMTLAPFNGSSVRAILDKSSTWGSHNEQNHDLFITSSSSSSFLTGGPSTAGFLTQGAKPMPNAPPPVDKDEGR